MMLKLFPTVFTLEASGIVVGLASPGHTSNEGCCCKENININKSETSKLNVEPLQMKRKKKGGGYNLRNSLAWDRAFFTEEGVLDPLELSMITGVSCRELPIIDEGDPGGSQPATEPLDLQKLENYQPKLEISQETSSLSKYSSANMSPQPGGNAYNSGSTKIAADMNSSSLLHSSEGQNQPANFSATFSQIARSSGRIMHLSQNQNMKPSGLRMPSPSLSFFGQPKASVSDSLSLRDADIDACGPQKPENSRLQDKMMRTPEIANKITKSTKSNTSRCFRPSTTDFLNDALNIETSFSTLAEDNKFVDGRTDDLVDKKGSERITSLENVNFLKVDYEIPQQTENFELEIDSKNFQVANHSCTTESQSRGSGWRSLETSAEKKIENHKSDAEKTIDEPCEERNTFDVSMTNHDANFGTPLEEETDNKGQNSKMTKVCCKDTCKPDCYKPIIALTDELKHSPSEIDKRGVEMMERAIELVGLSELQSSISGEGAASEVLENRSVNIRRSDFGFDCQDEKPDSIDHVTDDQVQAGQAHMQDAAFALPIPDSKNRVNLVPKIGDDIKESGNTLMIQDVCLRVELDSLKADEYHPSEGLFSANLKSQLEETVEMHSFHFDRYRNDRNKLDEINVDNHQTPAENCVCNSDKVELIEHTLTDTEGDFVDNSPLIHRTFHQDGVYVCKISYCEPDVPSRETFRSEASVNVSGDDINFLRNDELLAPANGNMSEVLYLVNGAMEIDQCGSFPKTNDHEVPQNMSKEVTKPMPLIKDDCQMNWEGSGFSTKEGVDNKTNISESRNTPAQGPETHMSDECCIGCWDNSELPNDRTKEEKKFCSNDGLPTKNHSQNQITVSDESLENYSLGSMFATVSESNIRHFGAVKATSISADELSLKSECCSISDGSDGQSCFVDLITDRASIEPFSDSKTVEIHQETINSICDLHSNSDHDKAKSTLETNNNKNGIGCTEKGHSCILPSTTIPFSDEWLAVIEAAGENE
ncbi:hypothetical protein F511_06837 [Dorcoceras hygrometricum]|uniref:Uncharacterized protein n=1 Tax=Dorcoceras hygrometricum TaxID=472368 RepID=A0A2Z7BKM1_9LAMI|nr:hypothetical protein F511_06837 [Dorcoceras hygrometricum]